MQAKNTRQSSATASYNNQVVLSFKAVVSTLATAAWSLALCASAAEPIKVKTDSGVLVGAAQDGVSVFKGVPFARPPVGPLRWEPPAKPDPWTGERDATKFALPCPQPMNADGKPNPGGAFGPYDEDCLYLNVWAPAHAHRAPVILWLYGGGAREIGRAHV